ncbi:MAG: stage II sporulation protein P, partial [Bacilli bacterium]
MKRLVRHALILATDFAKLRSIYIRFIFALCLFVVAAGILQRTIPEKVARPAWIEEMFPPFWYVGILGGENAYYLKGLEVDKQPRFRVLEKLSESVVNVSIGNEQTMLTSEIPLLGLYNSSIAVRGEHLDYSTLPVESAPDDHAFLNEPIVELPALNLPESETYVPEGNPSVYIFHTHNRESFFPMLPKGTEEPFHSKANITIVGERFASR